MVPCSLQETLFEYCTACVALCILSVSCVDILTEEVREQLRLVVMHHSHTHGVEAHQAEHSPIKSLRLHYLADEESHSPLLLTVIAILTALYTGAGKTWGDGERHDRLQLSLTDFISFFGPTHFGGYKAHH